MEDFLALVTESTLQPDGKRQYLNAIRSILQEVQESDIESLSAAVKAIPTTSSPSCLSLASLLPIKSGHAGPWPTLDLVRFYNRSWRDLPEEIKTKQDDRGARVVERALAEVKGSYSDLTSILPQAGEQPALIDPVSSQTLSHNSMNEFINDFSLPLSHDQSKKPIVAIALPNGPYLGLACLATSTYFRAAPLNTAGGTVQFKSDILQVRARAVLVFRSMIGALNLDDPWYEAEGISILVVEPSSDLTFTVSRLDGKHMSAVPQFAKNGPDDIGLILMTSGTSGNKKIVPMTIHSIVCGVTMVIDSWGLQPDDCCLNMMPLNHVGGLIRNLFAPIVSGGSTICCSSFDPSLFWDIVEYKSPTWYYASPTMHSTILEESSNRLSALEHSKLRLVCNAAGGLLPSLATQLRDTFDCVVLPSYGMTECMPISTPPLDYALQRPGTSGITIGPDLGIFNENHQRIGIGMVGNICVRGDPVFMGYLTADNTIDKTAFDDAGWFNTGDMGYLDGDSFLFVTGRSKEVINRGGELISPLEIEEEIMKAAQHPQSTIYGRVKEVLAFSTPHDVLQEVVGVVLVVPAGVPRPDLRQLKDALRYSLHQSKLPEAIVYMDGIPKKANKVIRTNLSDRLSLPNIHTNTTLSQRHFQAVCPEPETPSSRKIQQFLCRTSPQSLVAFVEEELEGFVECYIDKAPGKDLITLILAPRPSSGICYEITTDTVDDLKNSMQHELHGYLIPSSVLFVNMPFPLLPSGEIDRAQLMTLIDTQSWRASLNCIPMYEKKIREVFADILSIPFNDVSATSDFFAVGGDSLRAGRFISAIRKELNVRIPIQALFNNSSVQAICDLIGPQLIKQEVYGSNTEAEDQEKESRTAVTNCSSTNPIVLLLQLFPMMSVFPLRRAFEWTVLLYALSSILHRWPIATTALTRLLILIISVMIAKTGRMIVAPILAMFFKWLVIGKYREGLYPMWGVYHTRWWLTQKVISITGMGIFQYTNATRILYLRLMGASIGSGVSIDRSATLGEFDLLSIGDGVRLYDCICRPFGVERNTTMYLGQIKLGKRSYVGLKSIIAPGATLPPGTCIGPNSSSWELSSACETNYDLSKCNISEPSILLRLLVGWPIVFCIKLIAFLPRGAGLYGLVQIAPAEKGDWVNATIFWFAEPTRVGWHFLAYVLSITLGTFVYFGIIIAMKRTLDFLFGKMQPGLASHRSEFRKLRMWLMETLLPNGDLSELTEFFGTHYEATSIVVRALGGRVGKRVYWPGHGPSIQDFDLIEIGEDVVFGSRSHIITSDGSGSHAVKIGAGTMIADRIILLPGTVIGENVVMGSGALTKRDTNYDNDTVWVGSKNGEAICLTGPGTRDATSPTTEPSPYGNDGTNYTKRQSKIPDRQIWSSSVELSTLNSPDQSPDITPRSSHAQSPDASTVTLVPKEPMSSLANAKKDAAFVQVIELDQSIDKTTIPRNFQFDGPRHLRNLSRSVSSPDSRTPFGRAFYEGKAPYHVLGLFSISIYSTFIKLFVAIYWNSTTVATVQILSIVIHRWPKVFRIRAKPAMILGIAFVSISVILMIQALLAMAIVVVAKWSLMGRRKVGNYDWDKSSYCQRWQILLAIEKIRRDCFGGAGIAGMLSGTHYLVLFFRALGASIGKDCALFAGGKPSLLFTEPDLLTLDDRVVVDDASLVAHINSRGNFTLNELRVGEGSVLRSGSRLLSGSCMEDGSVLLEHTLVVGGNVVERGSVYQGWPAEYYSGKTHGL